ncbi:MAG: 6-phosphogluconolactonase [Haliea sp.]|jgi:6-phosphogluconolactonase|nr:6-phosphogluconolactonase [Haliea sp.]
MNRVEVFDSPEAVAQAVASYLFERITGCVSVKGQCHVVLPGGRTPSRCLELLAERPLPWQSIHWYPGDERCYPAGHAERNDSMMCSRLFSRHAQAMDNFHAIPAERGSEQGAKDYAVLLDGVGTLDIVVLGMGEDGHTASLFPGNAALDDPRSAVPVHGAPKPPSERISLGLNMLRHAGERIVIATGEGKREALAKAYAGEALPVTQVGADIWFVDEAAMGQ